MPFTHYLFTGEGTLADKILPLVGLSLTTNVHGSKMKLWFQVCNIKAKKTSNDIP